MKKADYCKFLLYIKMSDKINYYRKKQRYNIEKS